jgi:hypothetical protein
MRKKEKKPNEVNEVMKKEGSSRPESLLNACDGLPQPDTESGLWALWQERHFTLPAR